MTYMVMQKTPTNFNSIKSYMDFKKTQERSYRGINISLKNENENLLGTFDNMQAAVNFMQCCIVFSNIKKDNIYIKVKEAA